MSSPAEAPPAGAPAGAITPSMLRDWSLPRPEGSKRSRGHVLVVGGSPSTPGAVLLAGLAALRVGAGVLAMAVPEAIALPLAIQVPEAGVTALPAQLAAAGHLWANRPRLPDAARQVVSQTDAVLIGPGFADPQTTVDVLIGVLAELDDSVPVVLDAFALGVLPGQPQLREQLAGRVILTPNASEAARLLDTDTALPDAGPRIADRWDAVVSYHGTVVTPGGSPLTVGTGHSGLGTSGSGDVLAGAVAGLLARGASPLQAACWGTYLHAAAGDRLAARIGRLGFLARELVTELPALLTELDG